MGNCVPTHKASEPPAMELKTSIINSQENLCLQLQSPIKDNNLNSDLSISELNSKFLQSSSPSPYDSSFRVLSNREETFFDSQPWMESDIEDFVSVNGDFTPLGSTTPDHQGSFTKNPQCDESPSISSPVNPIPEPSPTEFKKQLIEYFRESFSDVEDKQDLQDRTEAKSITFYLPSKCTSTNAYATVNETTPNGCINRLNGKPAQSEAQCCFPNLIRSLSFSERKKRLSSPYNGCL